MPHLRVVIHVLPRAPSALFVVRARRRHRVRRRAFRRRLRAVRQLLPQLRHPRAHHLSGRRAVAEQNHPIRELAHALARRGEIDALHGDFVADANVAAVGRGGGGGGFRGAGRTRDGETARGARDVGLRGVERAREDDAGERARHGAAACAARRRRLGAASAERRSRGARERETAHRAIDWLH